MLTEYDKETIEKRVALLTKQHTELISVKKEERNHRAIDDVRVRITNLKLWLKRTKETPSVDPKVQVKIDGRKMMKEKFRKSFEEMLVKLDKEPESGETLIFNSRDEVDAVIDLIHREIVVRKPPRTNLYFGGRKGVVSYMAQLIRKRVFIMPGSAAETVANRINEVLEKEDANENESL